MQRPLPDGGGHDEREQTLNQMLVEMDGFDANAGIIVMAATNRIDILDPAILRPGRFDRKIMVGQPDVKGRLAILKVHASHKPMADDVDLESLAKTTAGFTGADLENVLNEAAINAATRKHEFITNEDVKDAFIKEGIGKEKKSRVISEKEKKITAYHESGTCHIISCSSGCGSRAYNLHNTYGYGSRRLHHASSGKRRVVQYKRKDAPEYHRCYGRTCGRGDRI